MPCNTYSRGVVVVVDNSAGVRVVGDDDDDDGPSLSSLLHADDDAARFLRVLLLCDVLVLLSLVASTIMVGFQASVLVNEQEE